MDMDDRALVLDPQPEWVDLVELELDALVVAALEVQAFEFVLVALVLDVLVLV